jgi:hypothetical protein
MHEPEVLLRCPVCNDEEPVKQNGIVGLTVMCRKANCVANFPIPYAIWQSIPRFPDYVDTKICQHCELQAPGDEYATPFDRGNALELIQALQEGNEVGPAAWDLLRKCISSPRNWKYCDTKDCAIVGAELSTAQHFEEQRNAWKLKARAAEAQIEKMLRHGVVQFASEKYLRVSDTVLLPPCPRCDQLPDVDGNVVQHYEECDDQGEHGKGQLFTYTVAEWWKHVAEMIHCQNCWCEPGYLDEGATEFDPDAWDEEEGKWYHQCNMEQSGHYTPEDWWFANVSLRKIANMPHGEELLAMRLDSLREK